jgi:hypothetical protein
MAMFVAMNAGKVQGMFCVGQNPATSVNAKLERSGLRKLALNLLKDKGTLLKISVRRGQANGLVALPSGAGRERGEPVGQPWGVGLGQGG